MLFRAAQRRASPCADRFSGMATKKYVPPPPPIVKVFLAGEFAPAIAKLTRRIEVIQKFIDEKVYEEDQRVEVAEEDTRNAIPRCSARTPRNTASMTTSRLTARRSA